MFCHTNSNFTLVFLAREEELGAQQGVGLRLVLVGFGLVSLGLLNENLFSEKCMLFACLKTCKTQR